MAPAGYAAEVQQSHAAKAAIRVIRVPPDEHLPKKLEVGHAGSHY